MSSAIKVHFGGAALVLDAAGALYWPARQLLAVSDLHFEKSTFLNQFGSAIAPYDTHDTLDRLEGLIVHYRPQQLLLLGDSFHDRHAWQRLDTHSRERMIALADSVPDCCWIEGNHDAHLTPEGLPAFEALRQVDNIYFTHDYLPGISPQIIGHYHPSVAFSLQRQKIRGRCFVLTEHLLIMPAFGSYTGGLDIRSDAFTNIIQHPMQLYFMHGTRIYPLESTRYS